MGITHAQSASPKTQAIVTSNSIFGSIRYNKYILFSIKDTHVRFFDPEIE